MNVSSVSTSSTCFSGNPSAEAEELRQRRDRLVVRATDLSAQWDTLKDQDPAGNLTERSDFDENVELYASELHQWRCDALTFAGTFELPDVRKKMTKKVQNHVRREKSRLIQLRTLYDEDDETKPPPPETVFRPWRGGRF